LAARTVPPDLPSWRTATPLPATVKASPGATARSPAERCRRDACERVCEFEQRPHPRSPVRQQGLQIEIRMRADPRDIAQRGRPR